MSVKRWSAAAVAAAMLTGVAHLQADVRTQERTQMKFEGMLGRMMGMFGGKAAKEGLVSTVALKGNRKLTLNDTTGQIVDLDEEKVYELDVKKKTYEVVTFEQLRQRLEEARKKAEENAARMQGGDQKSRDGQPAKEVEVDFDVKDTGQKKTVAGHEAREMVTTIVVREKGKTLEEAGGMVLTVNSWLGPKVDGVEELAQFDRRFFERVFKGGQGADAQDQMVMALAMYPGLRSALEKVKAESANVEGTPLLTVMKFETVQGAAQAAQAQSEDEQPKGIGGLLAGKMMKKEETAPGGRTLIMTSTSELLSVSSDAGDVSVPAGYKEKR